MYIYIYIYACMYVCMYIICIYAYMHIYIYIYMYTYINIYLYLYLYISLFMSSICMYMCICFYIQMAIYHRSLAQGDMLAHRWREIARRRPPPSGITYIQREYVQLQGGSIYRFIPQGGVVEGDVEAPWRELAQRCPPPVLHTYREDTYILYVDLQFMQQIYIYIHIYIYKYRQIPEGGIAKRDMEARRWLGARSATPPPLVLHTVCLWVPCFSAYIHIKRTSISFYADLYIDRYRRGASPRAM